MAETVQLTHDFTRNLATRVYNLENGVGNLQERVVILSEKVDTWDCQPECNDDLYLPPTCVSLPLTGPEVKGMKEDEGRREEEGCRGVQKIWCNTPRRRRERWIDK